MIRRLLVSWVVLAVAIGLTAALLPGIDVDGAWSLIGISAVFGLVNAILGTILRLLTLPFTIITLGLSALVVNGFLLVVTDWLSSALDVDGFLTAVLGALVIAVLTTLITWPLNRRARRA